MREKERGGWREDRLREERFGEGGGGDITKYKESIGFFFHAG